LLVFCQVCDLFALEKKNFFNSFKLLNISSHLDKTCSYTFHNNKGLIPPNEVTIFDLYKLNLTYGS